MDYQIKEIIMDGLQFISITFPTTGITLIIGEPVKEEGEESEEDNYNLYVSIPDHMDLYIRGEPKTLIELLLKSSEYPTKLKINESEQLFIRGD